ncbi:MAG: SDR family NAD(P)-dependent oxidoreductase, partial [Gammaproteobacteria bacterium]|nr:SDR family NAD(P)-dependent oxidoreductase [Gammaproteobacteria bacterium]
SATLQSGAHQGDNGTLECAAPGSATLQSGAHQGDNGTLECAAPGSAAPGSAAPGSAAPGERGNLVYFKPHWQEQPVSVSQKKRNTLLFVGGNPSLIEELSRLLPKEDSIISARHGKTFEQIDNTNFLLDFTEAEQFAQLLDSISNQTISQVLYFLPEENTNNEWMVFALQQVLHPLFYLSRALTAGKPKQSISLLTAGTASSDRISFCLFAALSGFVKTLNKENPRINYKSIIFEPDADDLPNKLLKELQASDANQEIHYTGKQRLVKSYQPFDLQEGGRIPLKQNGVYLISGGLGGLGLIFADFLARHYQAKLALTGRSELKPEKEQQLQQLKQLGSKVLYLQSDIGNEKSAAALIKKVKKQFGPINGIIHSAGMVQDALISRKTTSQMQKVIAPKVAGTLYLDQAAKHEKLDFLVLFSSISGAVGNLGQCDYAYANAFMDQFAQLRNKQAARQERFGKTLSINWPLWRSGGMQVDEHSEKILFDSLGMIPLQTDKGLSAWQNGLAADQACFGVVEGDAQRITAAMGMRDDAHVKSDAKAASPAILEDNDKLRQQTEALLKSVLTVETKLDAQQIHSAEPLENYGIDSVMIMSLTRELEKTFGTLSKTLFFEYQTLEELCGYLLENHHATLSSLFNTKESKEKSTAFNEPGQTIQKPTRSRFLRQPVAAAASLQKTQDIAIIGVSGRYPMADTLQEYWDNLQSGKDCISEIPKERWDYRTYYDTDKSKTGKSYSKWGGFINGVDQFDPLFFQISPREAELIDPQERLFLETVYHTMEDAGYTPKTLQADRQVGVFVGVMWGHYQLYGVNPDTPTPNSPYWSVANRVSYHFNFKGPSLAVDTACSSSLTAIHLACESLSRGTCKTAFAGGVNLTIHPNKYLILSQDRFVSSDGRCRSFGEGGDGYVPGEGVGAVLLKPLSAAIADGDRIYAVIKGGALNHGGKTNGYTVPNPHAQAEVIKDALHQADIDPRTISYLEAHGTGTSLGDPIEITGLVKAFAQAPQQGQYCAVGSAKSNIGHLESAAGIAALTKVLLQLKHKTLAPSLHSARLNPNIQFNEAPFYVQQTKQAWNRPVISENGLDKTILRRAGISSFGAGGANAHIILEEYPESNQPLDQSPRLIVISAKNTERLREHAGNLLNFLQTESAEKNQYGLSEIAYTLQLGREAMQERLAFVAENQKELASKLTNWLDPTPNDSNDSEEAVYSGNSKQGQTALLIEGEAGRSFINTVLQMRDLDKLAKLWVLGIDIDWQLLYSDNKPKKISLPNYPFARERYWVPVLPPSRRSSAYIPQPAKTIQKKQASLSAEPQQLLPMIRQALKELAAELVTVAVEKIDITDEINDYGFDSVRLTEFSERLNSNYGLNLTPAIFFKYSTLESLAGFFYESHQAIFSKHFRTQLTEPATEPESAPRRGNSRAEARTPDESQHYWDKSDRLLEKRPVAIIGMDGILPQSPDMQTFWRHLVNSDDLIVEIPEQRWNWREYFGDPTLDKTKSHSKWLGYVDDVDKFDAAFFKISPQEAQMMDPQQRLFLEVVWRTLEDAGYKASDLSSERVGIFAGVQFQDYQALLNKAQHEPNPQMGIGNSHAVLVNRISYLLNFKGPSQAIDTACSSSLVAIHQAVRSIQLGESRLAIAGGVSLALSADTYVNTGQLGVFSADGRCKTFDKSANGYVKGEGAGAVLLKPLEQAVNDGDHIYAVIAGTAVNHGGKANSLTAPNSNSQADVLVKAYQEAGFDPQSVGYIETHGTGTKLGDPIEIEGLKDAFATLMGKSADQPYFCGLGSVKTHIGHLEPAAGIAGVLKLLLMIQHKTLPANLHFDQLNPYIDLQDSPFYIVDKTRPWPVLKDGDGQDIPRRAGISSFGFGGANAHMVIEAFDQADKPAEPGALAAPVFVLSAKNRERLKPYAKKLLAFLQKQGPAETPSLNSISDKLSELGAQALSVDDSLDKNESLGNFGFDAVRYTDFITLINDAFGLEESSAVFVENPGIAQLAHYLYQQYPRQFSALATKPAPVLAMNDLLYTLQIGREAMPERLAVIAADIAQLTEKLERYCQGQADIQGVYQGKRKQADEDDDELQDELQRAVKDKDFDWLARHWVSGLEPDWRVLYQNAQQRPKRISLPAYPFARQRHWIPQTAAGHSQRQGTAAALHPLLGSNTSTLHEQKFTTRLQVTDFYLADHRVADHATLPGVAYLEMARAAGELSARANVSSIKNIVWAQPVRVIDEKTVDISLFATDDIIDYEVSSDEQGERVVHAQGRLGIDQAPGRQDAADIPAIQARCNQFIDGSECYRRFSAMGLHYGPAFQAIKQLYHNDQEVLARLHLPETVANDKRFVLHPSLMDGCLQSLLGFMLDSSETWLPFSMSALEINGQLTDNCYAYVRYHQSRSSSTGSQHFDIRLLDQSGRQLIGISDYVMRVLSASKSEKTEDILYWQPQWQALPLQETQQQSAPLVLMGGDETLYEMLGRQTQVIWLKQDKQFSQHSEWEYRIDLQNPEHYKQLFDALETRKIIWWVYCLSDKTAARQVDAGSMASEALNPLLYLGRLLSQSQTNIQLITAGICSSAVHRSLAEALSGFGKTLQQENPRLSYKSVLFDPDEKTEQTAQQLLQELQSDNSAIQAIRYQGGQRLVKSYQLLQAGKETFAFKSKGVYLITGGLGGLGYIFAGYLAQHYQARLVLTGRTDIDAKRQTKLDLLKQAGAEVFYAASDICKAEDIQKLMTAIKEQFGQLQGVLHCAGLIRDALIVNKTAEQMLDVIGPKVMGAVLLDEATKEEPLDFFVLFSSLAGVIGNPGQADYAFANAFMDSYAENRQYHGRTLSINWPIWQHGGMQIDEQTRKTLLQTTGIKPLQTEAGLQALRKGLALNVRQLAIAGGQGDKLTQMMAAGKPLSSQTASVQQAAGEYPLTSRVQQKIETAVLQVASAILKVDSQEIDLQEDIHEYGFDSISITELTNRLNQLYQLELTPALLFEYPALGDLIAFLGESHADKFIDEKDKPSLEQSAADSKAKPRQIRSLRPPFQAPTGRSGTASEPIAIIGMAGVLPASPDLQAFWQHLVAGDDLIREVPPDRWDWQAIYGDAKLEAEKTKAKWGGFIDGVDQFDAAFFGISPREAELMDPQQRLFLQTVWLAIEDAGIKAANLSGTQTGLFVGVGTKDYHELMNLEGVPSNAHLPTGVSHSILANRISFLLDLHGPSEAIDTACSSSLVAIHRAVIALQNGECEQAIAGGVNVLLSPKITIAFSKAGMLSEDGRCKTFDDSANGYVRGEGAGAVLLKFLSQAEADGDPIIALIKGSAENHGGHAKSLTAPNPNAQAEVLSKAYKKAGFAPDSISYIEAHGTGTSLGDPIEINGLKKAFVKMGLNEGDANKAQNYCGIGSVKTNIGHLETAAGIAGVLKVLLAMQHQTLPKHLHFNKLNRYIKLEKSPFYIVDKNQPWTALNDEAGQPLPRRAGVSSFGFGGSNVHIALEEHPKKESEELPGPSLIVLSAKNTQCLTEYAGRLLHFVKQYRPSLRAAAWTLQSGREAMPERLALVVENLDELIEKLTRFGDKDSAIPGLYQGNAKQRGQTADLLVDGEEGRAFIDLIISQGKLEKLARLWVNGIEIDWSLASAVDKPQRISLPGYPFAKSRYWLPKGSGVSTVGIQTSVQIDKLHPLLHRNTSTLQMQQFTTVLQANDFYLKDHQVGQDKILPGAAYLEIARAAGEFAGISPIQRLSDIIWSRPIRVSDKKTIDIRLFATSDVIDYEIVGYDEQQDAVVHGQGKLLTGLPSAVPAAVSIAEIEQRCSRSLDKNDCYALYKEMGLNYGPGFQVIDHVRSNDQEALARLVLPAAVAGDFDDYRLHPSLLDGALQAIIGLYDAKQQATFLPFSMGRVSIYGALPRECYAHVRVHSAQEHQGVKRYDIQILDSSGQVLLAVEEFTARMTTGQSLKPDAQDGIIETLYFQPEWQTVPLESSQLSNEPLLLIGGNNLLTDALRELGDVIRARPGKSFESTDDGAYSLDWQNAEQVKTLVDKLLDTDQLPSNIVYCLSPETWPQDIALNELAQKHILQPLFYLSQALLQQKNLSLQILIAGAAPQDSIEYCLMQALNGFAIVLHAENRHFNCKTMVTETIPSDELSTLIRQELQNNRSDSQIHYLAGERLVKSLQSYDNSPPV